ncbi:MULTISPECIES: glutathione S-transferase family protein [unclassified Sphingomonas]|uniref:glutathione S-transferase family protein n=1 Tax=unclassified Sphingomonas TaxID=196159 RepID=UPI00083460FD|nr:MULTISPECIES: glutathione S-transferase family protein [unclassified Sphingomonas]
MPVDPEARVSITAFDWVPAFARGQVRDLRVRWALEEAGIPYSVRLMSPRGERPADYFADQPFGQVPCYRDDDVVLFETGAILLYLGDGCEALLPRDRVGRARATSWLIAALNSVEPVIQQLTAIDLFHAGEDWTAARRPQVVEMVERRLMRLAAHLGQRDYLEDRFTAGDLMMTSVLRILNGTGLVDTHPNLVAYRDRCAARPAFAAALAAQLADFREPAAA